ncbi:histidine phosphatase family protein [Streptococcus caprae]|uniref:Histidine phosphatase family protein n=1 Tax=Streptococcus caprae TaxID=1640501 RepID=A0ABV8CVM0_9STRE
MSTTVYFVRHAEPNYQNHDDAQRELTEKGLQVSIKVTEYLKDKGVHQIYSSPFKRAVDTIKHLSETLNLQIHQKEDFRERKIDNVWIEDFDSFVKQQWQNFAYKLKDGESLGEVQERQVRGLNELLVLHPNETIVVGSHGTALSTLINYYSPNFGLQEFQKIKSIFPFLVKFTFTQQTCLSVTLINILEDPVYEKSLV